MFATRAPGSGASTQYRYASVKTRLIIASSVLAAAAMVGCPRIQVGYDFEDMVQGKRIAEYLRSYDKGLNVGWESGAHLISYTYGGPIISIYAVTETDHQDAIIARIDSMKKQGLVNRKVEVRFYEQQNMIWTGPDRKGAWGGRQGPERLIRVAKL